MGGCASRPKEFESSPNSVPTDQEAPASPKKAEQPEADAQEKGNGGENNNDNNKNENAEEAPLVDLSEPKKEAAESSSKATTKDAETADNNKSTDQEPKLTAEITDQKKVEAAAVGIEPRDKATADKSADAPTSSAGKDKTDHAPLITV